MTRDNSIDILRFIGLSAIVLAHVKAPNTITQIRCFDVPLMLFISGLVYSGKVISNYWKFVKFRTLRLIVPTYLFLTTYLLLLSSASLIMGKNDFVTRELLYKSYLMIGGIGYLWIIRVFLMIMLVTPLLGMINKVFIKNNTLFISALVGGGNY